MASLKQENGEPVPGLAPAAMQEGESAAANILNDIKNKPRKDFRYVDKGTMATIGRRRAIADIRGWKFSGLIAWFMWLGLHIVLLIGFRNRFYVLLEWFWAYLTRERSARLITGDAEELREAVKFMEGESAVRSLDEI
jgi:NADH dehydrogenase